MKVFCAVLTGALLMLPAIAAAQDVKIDFDKAFDFSTVKTYAIKIGTPWGNNLSERRVLTEIDEEIAGKGWKKVDEGQANILVILHGANRTSVPPASFKRHGVTATGMASAHCCERTQWHVSGMFETKDKNRVFAHRRTRSRTMPRGTRNGSKRRPRRCSRISRRWPRRNSSGGLRRESRMLAARHRNRRYLLHKGKVEWRKKASQQTTKAS